MIKMEIKVIVGETKKKIMIEMNVVVIATIIVKNIIRLSNS
jgi:hypothetical protein